jgi:uncharacterized RDD family membrane protein YckC
MSHFATSSKRKRRSVADTLLEAEREHYLDCPNGDLPIRSAAFLLDLIFVSLGSSGIHHLIETLKNSIPPLIGMVSEPAAPLFVLGVTYFSWLLKTAALYLYFVWTVMRFGGTPAKLLMGLRIVDTRTGDRLDYQQAILREIIGKLVTGVSVLAPLASLRRPDRRMFHDLVSGSCVKKVRGEP